MAGEKNKDGCEVVKWTIENFSAWNKEVHGKVITSPKFMHSIGDPLVPSPIYSQLEVYPNGLSGNGEHLVVCVCGKAGLRYVNLSFIGSDGSIISQECKVRKNKKEKNLELPSGPKFQDFIALSRKKKTTLHKDSLTLLCRLESEYNIEYHQRTKIEVVDTSVKIPIEIIEALKMHKYYNGYGSSTLNLSTIQYPLDEGTLGGMALTVEKKGTTLEDYEIEFRLNPSYSSKKKISAHILMSLLKSDDTVFRSEENEFIFKNSSDLDWTFSTSLTKEEEKTKGISLLFRLKIATGYITCGGHYTYHPTQAKITDN